MLNQSMMQIMIIAQFMKMEQKNSHRGYDWTQEFVQPIPEKISLIDRALPVIGEKLIRMGNRMKQHSRARLTADGAQTPTFMIML